MLSHVWVFVAPCSVPARLLCLWNFPCKSIGVGCHFLLQGIFPVQGWNWLLLHLLHYHVNSLPLHHLGSPQVSSSIANLICNFNLNCRQFISIIYYWMNQVWKIFYRTSGEKKDSPQNIRLIFLHSNKIIVKIYFLVSKTLYHLNWINI